MKCAEEYIRASQFGELQVLVDGIEQNKISASSSDSDGCSLLHWSAINQKNDVVTFLIDHDADINLTGGLLEEPPLMWSIRSGDISTVILFIEKGADILLQSRDGLDSLQLACRLGHVGICFLLLQRGANPDSFDKENNTSLLWLLKNKPNSTDIISLLLKFGVSVHHKDENDENALHVATRLAKRHSNEINFLLFYKLYLGHGAKGALMQENKRGHTPYLVAEKEIRNPLLVRFFWDSWMAACFPRYLPSVLSSIAVITFFYFLSVFRWYGVIYWMIAINCPVQQLSQPVLDFLDSRSIFGIGVGIIVSTGIGYHQYISEHMPPRLNAAVALLSLAALLLHILMTVRKPVCTSSSTASERNAVLEELVATAAAGPVLCPTCLVICKDSQFHCMRCDKCVVDGDHHNGLIMNCVGRGNRRFFVLFCFLCFVISLIYVSAGFFVQRVVCDSPEGIFWGAISVQLCMISINPAFAAICWLAFFTMAYSLHSLGMQLFLVSIDSTTLKLIRGKHDAKCRHAASTGLKHVLTFFHSGEYEVIDYPVAFRSSNDSPGERHSCCENHEVESLYAPIGQSLSIEADERA